MFGACLELSKAAFRTEELIGRLRSPRVLPETLHFGGLISTWSDRFPVLHAPLDSEFRHVGRVGDRPGVTCRRTWATGGRSGSNAGEEHGGV